MSINLYINLYMQHIHSIIDPTNDINRISHPLNKWYMCRMSYKLSSNDLIEYAMFLIIDIELYSYATMIWC
jgi:hypothetical protein